MDLAATVPPSTSPSVSVVMVPLIATVPFTSVVAAVNEASGATAFTSFSSTRPLPPLVVIVTAEVVVVPVSFRSQLVPSLTTVPTPGPVSRNVTAVPSASRRVSTVLPLRPGTVPNCQATVKVGPTFTLLASPAVPSATTLVASTRDNNLYDPAANVLGIVRLTNTLRDCPALRAAVVVVPSKTSDVLNVLSVEA